METERCPGLEKIGIRVPGQGRAPVLTLLCVNETGVVIRVLQVPLRRLAPRLESTQKKMKEIDQNLIGHAPEAVPVVDHLLKGERMDRKSATDRAAGLKAKVDVAAHLHRNRGCLMESHLRRKSILLSVTIENDRGRFHLPRDVQFLLPILRE